MSALISPSEGEKSWTFSRAVPHSAFDFHGLRHLCVKFEMVVSSLRGASVKPSHQLLLEIQSRVRREGRWLGWPKTEEHGLSLISKGRVCEQRGHYCS